MELPSSILTKIQEENLFKQLEAILEKIGGTDKVEEWAFEEARRLLASSDPSTQ